MAAARTGLGRARRIPGRSAAPGGRTGVRRDLCRRGVRRQRARPARRNAHLRGACRRLRVDRRLFVDPQHGGVDDRPLRYARAARTVSTPADDNGAFLQLLPDRAGQRFRCRGACHPCRARRRRLRAQWHEGVHLRRLGQRRLCDDGAHRRRGSQRHLLPRRRERRPGAVVRQKGKEARLELAADSNGDLRGLPRTGRQPARRRGGRVQDRDDGARRRPPQCFGLLARRRARLSRRGARASARTASVRAIARRFPGAQVQACRHGDRVGGGTAHGAAWRRKSRPRRSRGDHALRNGQTGSDRCRVSHLQRGPAAVRGLRLPQGFSDRALSARRSSPPDPRGHQRDHAGHHRPPPARQLMSESDEILLDRQGGLAILTINRPQALNALTLDNYRRFEPALRAWAADPSVHAVVVRGAGDRAFCAGGDVRAVYEAGPGIGGDPDLPAVFFREEYQLIRQIQRFPKPYIAIIDGITMGGGAGISVNGAYRVATEHTLFAMPETAIGLFPDVGATRFLNRCPGRLGRYLGLTGARLRAADTLYCGFATHFVPRERVAELVAELGRTVGESGEFDGVLTRFAANAGRAPLAPLRPAIDRCFAGDSIEEILDALALEAADGGPQ